MTGSHALQRAGGQMRSSTVSLRHTRSVVSRVTAQIFVPRSGASLIRKRSLVRIQVRPPVICRDFSRHTLRLDRRLQPFDATQMRGLGWHSTGGVGTGCEGATTWTALGSALLCSSHETGHDHFRRMSAGSKGGPRWVTCVGPCSSSSPLSRLRHLGAQLLLRRAPVVPRPRRSLRPHLPPRGSYSDSTSLILNSMSSRRR